MPKTPKTKSMRTKSMRTAKPSDEYNNKLPPHFKWLLDVLCSTQTEENVVKIHDYIELYIFFIGMLSRYLYNSKKYTHMSLHGVDKHISHLDHNAICDYKIMEKLDTHRQDLKLLRENEIQNDENINVFLLSAFEFLTNAIPVMLKRNFNIPHDIKLLISKYKVEIPPKKSKYLNYAVLDDYSLNTSIESILQTLYASMSATNSDAASVASTSVASSIAHSVASSDATIIIDE